MSTPEDAPTVTQEGEVATPAPRIPPVPMLREVSRTALAGRIRGDRYEIREELARGGMGLHSAGY
jgi:hypothetical protein